MPIVNYVREHIRFMEYATDEHLTASERLLWYALMHIMNQRAQGKVWPDEFVRISNDRLLSYCPMKYDTIASARNGLKQRGLIEYTPGEKNKKSPAYRMIYFYPEYAAPDTESDADIPQGIPKISDNIGGNTGYNIGGNTGGKPGGNTGDFIINYTDRRSPDRFQRDSEDEEDQEEELLRARARAEAASAWRKSFGKEATPAMLNELAWRTSFLKFDEGVLAKAIHLAASKGAQNPYEYVLAVLADWHSNKVRDVDDADEYAAVFDACNQRGAFRYATDGAERLREFRQSRETDEERKRREEHEAKEAAEREERRARIAGNKAEWEKAEYERRKAELDAQYANRRKSV